MERNSFSTFHFMLPEDAATTLRYNWSCVAKLIIMDGNADENPASSERHSSTEETEVSNRAAVCTEATWSRHRHILKWERSLA